MNLLNITVLPEYQHCHVTNAAPLDLTHVDTCFPSWLCLELFLWVCEVLSTASASAVVCNLTHWQEHSVGLPTTRTNFSIDSCRIVECFYIDLLLMQLAVCFACMT